MVSQYTSRQVTVSATCLRKSISTRAFSHLSYRVLFITTVTLAVNNHGGSSLIESDHNHNVHV